MTYRIVPLLVSTFTNFEKSVFTYAKNQGEKIDAPCISWLVQGNQNIIVDTGPPGPDWALRHHCTMRQTSSLLSELAGWGVAPEEVEWVVLTHLHWDHCYNLELFPNAKFIVQKRELHYAVTPLPTQQLTYETKFSEKPPWFAVFDRIDVIDGHHQLAAGLNALFIPGHTPGTQGVLVDTAKGKYLIASDAFPMYDNVHEQIPPGIHVDLNEWYSSLALVQSEADFVLPGHDSKVFDYKLYGE